MSRHGLRFHRTSGSAFKDARYGAAIEKQWPSFWRRLMQRIWEVLSS